MHIKPNNMHALCDNVSFHAKVPDVVLHPGRLEISTLSDEVSLSKTEARVGAVMANSLQKPYCNVLRDCLTDCPEKTAQWIM